MAAKSEGVETRPSNAVEETRIEVGKVADGVDDDTRDLITHDTTTRERTVNAKRAHEPLDLDAADDNQPSEDINGPRAAEVEPGKGPTAEKSTATVSEKQVKAGAAVRSGESDDNKK